MDENCNTISEGNFTDSTLKRGLVIPPPSVEGTQIVFFCKSGDCVMKITVTLVPGQGQKTVLPSFLRLFKRADLGIFVTFVLANDKSKCLESR